MKRIILATIFSILAGCQQPIVYVFTENFDEQQLQTLEQALNKQSLPYEYTQLRSEEHTSELQSPVPTSYAVFCLKKNTHQDT